MINPKKHIENIISYPVEPEQEWDLKLDFNENLIGVSPKVLQAIKNINPDKIKFYPAYTSLVKAIADYNKVNVENVLPVNGTDEGYRYIFDTYCGLGDNVLAVTPAFSMPKIYSQIANSNFIEVPYKNKWEFPINEFLDKIENSSIKVVIITSPNSPTGDLIPEENLKKIIETAKNSLVVIDETYANYADKTYMNYQKDYDNVVILKSMSKDFATAGLRLGYLISNPENIKNISKIISPYSVNAIAATIGSVALKDIDHLKKVKNEIEKSKKYLMEELQLFAQEIYPSKANFLCVDFGKRAKYFYKKLLKQGIKTKLLHGIAENCFRITVPPQKDAKKLVDVLHKKSKLLIFDMDGVLIDASQSYRIAIQKTFEYFSKKTVTLEQIQELKNQGGYNNDWILTKKLLDDAKVKVKYEDVVNKFNEFYFGKNNDGLVNNEKWLISKKSLEKLHKNYDLAIFTGRTRQEAYYALDNANIADMFEPVITMDDLADDEQKPSPKGIKEILSIVKPIEAWYFGDTTDDMKAGNSANVNTIGVLPPQDNSENLKSILLNAGAQYVLNNLDELPKLMEKIQ